MQSFNYYLNKFNSYGTIKRIKAPLIWIDGLPKARPFEFIKTETEDLGYIFSLEKEFAVALMLNNSPLPAESKTVLTGKNLQITASDSLLGLIINPLGEKLYGESFSLSSENKQVKNLDTRPAGLTQRTSIKKKLTTGVSIVDLLLPLGKGQRELIIGDKNTGKTTFALTVLKQQAEEGSIIIYAAIGKKHDEIKKLFSYLKDNKLNKNTVIVAATPDDPSSLIHLTPFAAITLAEFFKDKGQDVLVVFDDLSTHARYYREVALAAKRFPGRDSYPGDIFHIHAKILEKGGAYKLKDNKEAAITCLPIAETIFSDMSDYIVSNLISITDGHLLFDSSEFAKGRRPAIDPFLSVTRVGKQTQDKLTRFLGRKLTAFLQEYYRLTQFLLSGAERSKHINEKLVRGKMLIDFLSQPPNSHIQPSVQTVFAALIWQGLFPEEKMPRLQHYRNNLTNLVRQDKSLEKFIFKIIDTENTDEFISRLKKNQDKLLKICQAK